jgi:hypothetical protein
LIEIGWLVLIVQLFSVLRPAQEFSLKYGDVNIAVDLGLCSALRAFEQGGGGIVPHLL